MREFLIGGLGSLAAILFLYGFLRPDPAFIRYAGECFLVAVAGLLLLHGLHLRRRRRSGLWITGPLKDAVQVAPDMTHEPRDHIDDE